MSSILRALKKLEKNAQEKTAFKPQQQRVDARKASGRGNPGRHVRNSTFYALLAAFFLLIAGWLSLEFGPHLMETYLPGKPTPKPVEIEAEFTPTTVSPQLKTVKKTSPKVAQRPQKTTAKTRTTTIASRNGIPVSQKRLKNNPLRVKTTRAKAQSRPRTKHPRSSPSSAQATKSKLHRKSPVPRTNQKFNPRPVKANTSVEAEKPVIAKNKAENGFEVQAIAWSYTPEKRIAVINSQIVHEGDSVDGAYVSKIDMDDVSIKVGDETLRIKCGR